MAVTRNPEEQGLSLPREPDRSLDTVGLICPYPALETKRALKALENGQVLEVITNNEPTAKKSIPIICEQGGHTFTTVQEGDRWRILIRK